MDGAPSVSTRGPIAASDNAGGVMACIALIYCGFTFPIAAHVIPTMIAAREWSGVLVMLAFAGVGVGLLALAVMAWLGPLLHGRVVLNLDQAARVGEPFAGTISFARGVGEGDRFLVTLECQLVRQVSLANRGSHGSGTVAKSETLWSDEAERAAAPAGKLRFVFTPPPDLPGSAGADTGNSKIVWSVWVTRQNALRASSAFTVAVEGPPPGGVAMARLRTAAQAPSNTTKNPRVVYGLTGVAIVIFAGAFLFTLYQYASGLIQFAAQLFS